MLHLLDGGAIMNYKIFKDKKQVNTIVASAEFVKKYCAKNGYTYELVPTEPEPTETEQLRADVDFLAAMAGVTL